MKKTVYANDFINEFNKMGRGEQFSYEGLKALYEHLLFWEEEVIEDEIELDVIELCCTYTEYANLQEFWNDYPQDEYPTIEDIRDMTYLIDDYDDDAFIIMQF